MDVSSFLVMKAGTFRCALPLLHLVETMRPLPVRPLANAPQFVLGVSIIRGEPLPVVDLAMLLGVEAAKPARFVISRSGPRRVAMAVDAVLGIHNAPSEKMANVPPLLSQARAGLVQSLAALDKELLLVLETAQILPDQVWASISALEER